MLDKTGSNNFVEQTPEKETVNLVNCMQRPAMEALTQYLHPRFAVAE